MHNSKDLRQNFPCKILTSLPKITLALWILESKPISMTLEEYFNQLKCCVLYRRRELQTLIKLYRNQLQFLHNEVPLTQNDYYQLSNMEASCKEPMTQFQEKISEPPALTQFKYLVSVISESGKTDTSQQFLQHKNIADSFKNLFCALYNSHSEEECWNDGENVIKLIESIPMDIYMNRQLCEEIANEYFYLIQASLEILPNVSTIYESFILELSQLFGKHLIIVKLIVPPLIRHCFVYQSSSPNNKFGFIFHILQSILRSSMESLRLDSNNQSRPLFDSEVMNVLNYILDNFVITDRSCLFGFCFQNLKSTLENVNNISR